MLSASQKISLSAMAVALSVLFIYAASALPYVKIACIFISGIFVYALVSEKLYVHAFTAFIASALLGFLFAPDKLYPAAYALLLGHFMIFKCFIDEKVENKVYRFCIKLLYCNVFGAIGVAAVMFILKMPEVLNQITEIIPTGLVILIAEVAFVMLDLVSSLAIKVYNERIRDYLIKRS